MIYVDGKKAISSARVRNKHRRTWYVVAVVNSRRHSGFDALVIPEEWCEADTCKSRDAVAEMNGYANIIDALNGGKEAAGEKW